MVDEWSITGSISPSKIGNFRSITGTNLVCVFVFLCVCVRTCVLCVRVCIVFVCIHACVHVYPSQYVCYYNLLAEMTRLENQKQIFLNLLGLINLQNVSIMH